MGSRTADNEEAAAWAAGAGEGADNGTFADATASDEVVVNCTAGAGSLDALRSAERDNLKGKVLIDIANPLDFSQGMPPTLSVSNTDSLGEQIQREFPDATVVKALNTMRCDVMVDPARVPGEHDVFMCGNEHAAKALWLRLWGALGTGDFNIKVVQ
jgi:predicted dinucleotide-binding enzyme